MAPADGDWQSETLYSARDAEHFHADVEAAGEQWTDGWVKGIGYLPGSRTATSDRRRSRTSRPGMSNGYVEKLTGIEGETRHRCLEELRWMDVWPAETMGEPPTVEAHTDSGVCVRVRRT